MRKNLSLKLLPSEAADAMSIKRSIAAAESINPVSITGYNVQRQSIDARGRQPWVNLVIEVFIDEPFIPRPLRDFLFRDVSQANKRVVIIGAGPAGLFAALRLVELGIKPIILERGKDVRSRRRDLALLNKEGEINPESNYCFGEGGAGTYSDGKLYTRSSKRGDIKRILELFVHFGAEENILYEAHPHIGTNKLPNIISAMRKLLIECGAELLFEKKLVHIEVRDEKVRSVKTADDDVFNADAIILATGHSARDIFELLHHKKILIEAKAFALGVRVEHPQKLIDQVQYHTDHKDACLPPAAYSWVEQVEGKGVFSFCMCPGGIIAPAATSANELVVNGWSPSKRNNPFANSGIVVSLEEKDWQSFSKHGPLAAMYFQQSIEQQAYKAGGGKFVAPAQRLTDFIDKKLSSTLPRCSYVPGLHSTLLQETLPSLVYNRLLQAFKLTGKKFRGYMTNEAVVVATESRTSSPVRIPRTDLLHHPQLKNFYPCGEGAGYAGGIVSAAMDGERVANMIALI